MSANSNPPVSPICERRRQRGLHSKKSARRERSMPTVSSAGRTAMLTRCGCFWSSSLTKPTSPTILPSGGGAAGPSAGMMTVPFSSS